MSAPAPSTARPAYKRSWKNLLLNKSYQLRFTLFMVALAALLMVGLGYWVMKEANEATNVASSSVRGEGCDDVTVFVAQPEWVDAPETPPAPPPEAPKEAPPKEAPKPDDAGSGSAVKTEHNTTVVIESENMTMVPDPEPPKKVRPEPKVRTDLMDQAVKKWTCYAKREAKLEDLDRNRDLILYVLIGTGLLLLFGLAGYGLVMTHKVAGPIFKVGLYFKKMEKGRFDKVYNLRKGDQLVEFYDHFKQAHAGVVTMEKADITHLQKVIATAEAAGLGTHEAVNELREMLARKEKALE